MRSLPILGYLVSMLFALEGAAQTPLGSEWTYQGELIESGAPAEGMFDMTLSLWDAASAGAQIGVTIMRDEVPVAGGRFTVELDFGAGALDNSARWLEITVEGVTLSPRQRITRAPYAVQTRGIYVDEDLNLEIGSAEQVVGVNVHGAVIARGLGGGAFQTRNPNNDNASFTLGWLDDVARLRIGGSGPGAGGGLDIQRTGDASLLRILHDGRVGIGTTEPLGRLHAEASSAVNVAIQGVTNEASGTAVYGIATRTSLVNWGVRGESFSPVGNGVRGDNNSGGTGVYGEAFGGDLSIGVEGLARGVSSKGVKGRAQTGVLGEGEGAGNVGVEGISSSPTGSGIVGRSTALTGGGVGVRGIARAGGYDFYADGPGQDYGSSSSRRWKKNIEPVRDPLGILAGLRGVYFDWDEAHGGRRDFGMIAEEVGAVLPEIVRYEQNGIDAEGMDYSRLAPLLVEAVKALRSENERELASIRADNNALRGRNADLEARLSQLEAMVNELAVEAKAER